MRPDSWPPQPPQSPADVTEYFPRHESPPARPVRSALANAFWAGVAIAIVLAAMGAVGFLILTAAQVSGT